MERMSALDAEFLHVEDGVNHMHVASCAVFDGPAPSFAEALDAVRAKLPALSRYRQRVRFVPLGLGRPVWVDDDAFDLTYHVRQAALPHPGGAHELEALMGRLMSSELDRDRPLWEAWLVTGLEDGRWALVSKVHHCMIDGVAGVDLLTALLDAAPEPGPPLEDGWTPRPAPSAVHLVAGALLDLAASPAAAVRLAATAALDPRRTLAAAGDLARGFGTLARHLAATPVTAVDGSIGRARRWTATEASIDDVRTIRRGFGGTLNDVVLAAVSGAFRDLILHDGEDPSATVIRSLVPVSTRAPDQHGRCDNRVSLLLLELPVEVDDPVERLAEVAARMAALKASHMIDAGEAVTALGNRWPAPLVQYGTRAYARYAHRHPQRNVNTVTTNVPGPQFPLFALGRRLRHLLPYVPIAEGVRYGVAIMSYDGRLAFGLTGDWDGGRDLDVLRAGIDDGFTAMVKLAEAA